METTTNCGTCQHEIKQDANFCESCGISTVQGDSLSLTSPSDSGGQKLIFIALLILCGSTVYHFSLRLIMNLTGSWELYESFEPLSILILGGTGGVALFIAFGLKAGRRKLLSIIFASIYTLIYLYWTVQRLFPESSISNYFQF